MCLVNTSLFHIKIISINLKDGEKKYDREMHLYCFMCTSSYLNGRKQCFRINGLLQSDTLDYFDVPSGIPEYILLSALLFAICVNGLTVRL